MSTNHTPNYGLSQWEPGDQFSRLDFNEDHAKIDAAIRGAYPVLLKTSISGEEARKIKFDISGIEWTKYRSVVMELLFPTPAEFFIQFNGGGNLSYYVGLSSDSSSGEARLPCPVYRMICPVFYKDNLPLQYFGIGKDSCMGASNLTLREIHTMELEAYDFKAPADARIPAGTKILIWGIQ